MSHLLLAFCLISFTVANVPEKQIKDCKVGDVFHVPGDEFVKRCQKGDGDDSGRSVIIGCLNNNGAVKFGESFDRFENEYVGFRYNCETIDEQHRITPTHCLIGANRLPVLPGQSGPSQEKYTCTCTDDFGVTCT